jgi:tetratricopeptide (TPR) repeat protein
MAVSRYWTRKGLDEIRASPGAWFKLVAKKCWLTLWNAEVPNNKDFAFLQQEYRWLRWLPVRWVVLLCLAPAGLWAALKWGNRNALFILLVYAGLYSAANVAFFVCDRYRYPIWPALAALAGGALPAIPHLMPRSERRSFIWVLTGSLALMVLSLHNWFGARLPNFAQDYYFRSQAWYGKGDFQQALNDANRSLELDPRRAEVLHHRGNVLFALSRLDEAKAAYLQALKMTPGDSGAWNNLGATLDALGAVDEALQAFARATECIPPSRNAWLGMALVQIRSGSLEAADASLARFQGSSSADLPLLLAARAALERKRGNSSQADSLEQQARSLDPETVAWVMTRISSSGTGK